MRSKEEILNILATPGLLPEAKNLLEAQLTIIIEKETKSNRKKDGIKHWVGFGVSTAIGIAALIVAVIAIVI